MNYTIEPAAQRDASGIAKILSDWIEETAWMPRIHTREEERGFGTFLIEKTDVDVARREGRPIGFIAVQDDRIQALYIDARWRGQGVGQALLDIAMSERGELELWAFQANVAARMFYKKNGFCEVEVTDGSGNDEKLPDVRMIWRKAKP